MTIKQFLKQLPPEEETLRLCLEAVSAEFGNSLGRVEVVDDAEDVKLGLVWQKHARGVSLAVFPAELRAVQWKEPAGQLAYNGPEVPVHHPEDLFPLLRWLVEAPQPGELDYP
jgi:hypothetical protein